MNRKSLLLNSLLYSKPRPTGLLPLPTIFQCRFKSDSVQSRSVSKAHQPSDDDEDSGAMRRRLAQLAEEARPFKDDPLAGKILFEDETPVSQPAKVSSPPPASPHRDEEDPQKLVQQLVNKLSQGSTSEQDIYAAKYQREIAIATKIPAYASAATRDIAQGTPWTGVEPTLDAANRMLQDAHKPLKGTKSGAGAVLAPTSFAPKASVSQRLATARDKSLDYEIKHKASVKDATTSEQEKEGPTFRELYADRFAGFSAMGSDFTAIGSLATQRIEDAIARGEFKDLPGRGQKPKEDMHLSSPYIDHTEYYLNNMIKRQGAAPIWIDRQGGLTTRLADFRASLDRSWVSHVVHRIDDTGGTLAQKQARARQVAAAKGLCTWNAEWASKNRVYQTKSVESLNSAIRSYNLQAPGAARRGYLMLDKELVACYERAAAQLEPELEKFLVPKPAANALKLKGADGLPVYSNSAPSVFSKDMVQQTHAPYVIKEKGLLKGLFKNLWTVQEIKET